MDELLLPSKHYKRFLKARKLDIEKAKQMWVQDFEFESLFTRALLLLLTHWSILYFSGTDISGGKRRRSLRGEERRGERKGCVL